MSLSLNDRRVIMARALNNTGYMARHILDFNYDKDHATNQHYNIGSGGVRAEGPHREMTEFIDNKDTRFKHLLAPRGSLKTTILQAYVVRRLLQDPNVRILYVMDVYDKALKNLAQIRDLLQHNQKLVEVFGNQVGRPWSGPQFSVADRTIFTADPSVSAGGADKSVAGGHVDICILDDIVTEKNCKTPEQLEKTINYFKALMPVLDPGAVLILCGTRYADGDVHGYVMNELDGMFDRLSLDAGVELKQTEDGRDYLSGEPSFAHLNKEFLEERLYAMKAPLFSSQYLNTCLSGARQIFWPRHFQYTQWREWMSGLRTFILTDTAVATNEDACHSVIAVVGLEGQPSRDNAYLLDMKVGHWSPHQFGEFLCDTVEEWQPKVHLAGVTFEKIALNTALQAVVESCMYERKLRFRFIPIPRGKHLQKKDERIAGLQTRMEQRRFFVVDTVPRHFSDLGKTKVLFDPEGDTETGKPVPDGELVKQFTRFPVYPRKDIADCLADIDAHEKQRRFILPGSLQQSQEIRQNRVQRGEILPIPMIVNNKVVDVAPNHGPSTGGSNWWSRKARKLGRG